jgi:hypothetical protein
MIHGALVFANIFGLITDDEQNELITMETTTEPEEHKFTCSDCPYHYSDDDGEPECCHYNGEDNYAPCSYEEPKESYEEDCYYDEEQWDYADRNYNRMSDD